MWFWKSEVLKIKVSAKALFLLESLWKNLFPCFSNYGLHEYIDASWSLLPSSKPQNNIFKSQSLSLSLLRHLPLSFPANFDYLLWLWPSSFSCKDLCDYTGLIQIIRENFPISKFLTSPHLQHARSHFHKFWRWRHGHLWGTIIQSITMTSEKTF